MPVKNYKPTSPGRRGMSGSDFAEITRGRPEKSLTTGRVNKSGGRNAHGRTTIWHRGGGHKRRFRKIDFRRNKTGIPAKVAAIEYDPNRSCRIALINYPDGEKRYILAPDGIKVGDSVISSRSRTPLRPGNAMPLSEIPPGMNVHNVEMKPGKGGQLICSVGGAAQLAAREGAYATVRLRSGEARKIHVSCRATVDEVGHGKHNLRKLGKAGTRRW